MNDHNPIPQPDETPPSPQRINPLLRWRTWAILALPIAVILLSAIGPDGWRDPFIRLQGLSWTAICVALAHSARKALYDYANGRDAWSRALENPIGAGLAFLGLCIVSSALVLALMGFARAEVPPRAEALAPLVVQEIDNHWPGIPRRSYLGALVEQETCRTLQHRFCWSPSARLKTSREEGAGLPQLTRAWTPDGRLRFDALEETRAMAPQALQELNWNSVYERADLGLRAMLVKLRDCDRRMRSLGDFDPMERLAFCDAAYNGGWSGMQQDRKLCGVTPGCDPAVWFGHVEHTSTKSRAKWQGYGQSAFDINREHVRNTVPLASRREKYLPWLGV